jgi:hypothetical protein
METITHMKRVLRSTNVIYYLVSDFPAKNFDIIAYKISAAAQRAKSKVCPERSSPPPPKQ